MESRAFSLADHLVPRETSMTGRAPKLLTFTDLGFSGWPADRNRKHPPKGVFPRPFIFRTRSITSIRCSLVPSYFNLRTSLGEGRPPVIHHTTGGTASFVRSHLEFLGFVAFTALHGAYE